MNKALLIATGMLLNVSAALAQQPVCRVNQVKRPSTKLSSDKPLQPLPKVGGCPLAYYRALAATASPAPGTTPTSKP